MCIHFLRVPAAVQYNKTRNQTKAKGYMMNYNTVHWHAMQSRLIQYVPTQHKYIQCDEKQSTQLTPQALTRACARSLAHSHTHTHTQFFWTLTCYIDHYSFFIGLLPHIVTVSKRLQTNDKLHFKSATTSAHEINLKRSQYITLSTTLKFDQRNLIQFLSDTCISDLVFFPRFFFFFCGGREFNLIHPEMLDA